MSEAYDAPKIYPKCVLPEWSARSPTNGMVTLSKLSQSPNAYSPISVTPLGMTISVNAVPLNAYAPIDSKLSGSSTVRTSLLSNAPYPISVTAPPL